MKLIDRYLITETSGSFFFGVAIFGSLLTTGDLLGEALKLIMDKGVSLQLAAEVLLLRLPSVIVLTIPMATLLAMLLSFGRLSSLQEITSMRAGGISFVRIMMPVLLVGLLASFLTILLNEAIAPQSNRAAENILISVGERKLTGPDSGILLREPSKGPVRRIIFAAGYNLLTKTFIRPDVIEYAYGKPAALISADSASWDGETWQFTNGYLQTIGQSSVYTIDRWTTIHRELGKQPDEVERDIREIKPRSMTWMELRAFARGIRSRDDLDKKQRQALVEMHNKIAVPFSCLVFALVGAPLGMQPQRSSSSIGIGLSIVCIFLYYTIWYYASLLGQIGQLPPVLASWSGNIVTGAVGLALVAKTSR